MVFSVRFLVTLVMRFAMMLSVGFVMSLRTGQSGLELTAGDPKARDD